MPILGTIASSRQIASADAMTYISTTTVSGSSTNSVSLSSFGGYDDLVIFYAPRTHSGSNADNSITINNDTTVGNYRAKLLFASSSATGESSAAYGNIYRAGYMPYGDMTANYYGNNMLYVHDYASTSTYKTLRWQGASPINTSSSYMIMAEAVCYWNSTAAITSIQITCSPFGVNYADGSQFFVYGIKR